MMLGHQNKVILKTRVNTWEGLNDSIAVTAAAAAIFCAVTNCLRSGAH